MYQSTASNRQACGNESTTAGNRSWREEGWSKRYQSFVSRAEIAIAEWGRNQYSRQRGRQFCYTTPEGYPFTLKELAGSYPIMKRAVDLTLLRGNLPGADGRTYYRDFQTPDWKEDTIRKLKKGVRAGRYRPAPLRVVDIPKSDGGSRRLHIPTVYDRVVERALAMVLSPLFEMQFHDASYGFRRGLHLAHALHHMVRIVVEGGRWVVGKIDLSDAFDRVPHDRLLQTLEAKIPDSQLVDQLRPFIKRRGWVNKRGKSNVGLAQGCPLSPLLFNIYVDHVLDQVVARKYPEIRFIRYADDILLLCRDRNELEDHKAVMRELLTPAGLVFNAEKSTGPNSCVDLRTGEELEYLGFIVRWEKNELRLTVNEGVYENLLDQLHINLLGQQPEAGYSGRRRFQHRLALFTIGGFLEAYAGGIPESLWPAIRRGIRGWFFNGRLGDIAKSKPLTPIDAPSVIPTNRQLNAMYKRARMHWADRFTTPPDVFTRVTGVGPQRDAPASNPIRTDVPDFIDDGADLVPAPSVIIDPSWERKTGPHEVAWRIRSALAGPDRPPWE